MNIRESNHKNKNIQSNPLQMLGRALKQILHWCTRLCTAVMTIGLILFTAGIFYVAFYFASQWDQPLRYTPVPVSKQPPQNLSFQQFLCVVNNHFDAEGDQALASIRSREGAEPDLFRRFVLNNGFLLVTLGESPILISGITHFTIATIYPDSFIGQRLSHEDYNNFVAPLKGRFDSLVDLPKVLWLQTQAFIWKANQKEFHDQYQYYGLCFCNPES